MLGAPSKRLVWFEESGHEPFMDEPAKFNAAMAEVARPVLGGMSAFSRTELAQELPAVATTHD